MVKMKSMIAYSVNLLLYALATVCLFDITSLTGYQTCPSPTIKCPSGRNCEVREIRTTYTTILIEYTTIMIRPTAS